jgi:hypothetical protein
MMKSSITVLPGLLSVAMVILFFSAADSINMLRSNDNNNNNYYNHYNNNRRLLTDEGMHCGCKECDYHAWHVTAVDQDGAQTCGARIEFLVMEGMIEQEACLEVGIEFPTECGFCNPVQCTPRPQPRCGCPGCDDDWDVVAGDHTCGARITWLQTTKLLEQTLTEEEACMKVGKDE